MLPCANLSILGSLVRQSTILTDTITIQKVKVGDLGSSLPWIVTAKAKRILWESALLGNSGLLFWLARAQHINYMMI